MGTEQRAGQTSGQPPCPEEKMSRGSKKMAGDGLNKSGVRKTMHDARSPVSTWSTLSILSTQVRARQEKASEKPSRHRAVMGITIVRVRPGFFINRLAIPGKEDIFGINGKNDSERFPKLF